ncbi:MAG: hypothetical protein ACC683_05840 [Acidimicrobiia bacterium]
MTTFDTLARNSAQAIHHSVSDVRVPVAGIAAAVQAAAIWRIAGYAVAGATAGAAVVFALLIAGPTADEPAQDFAPTTNAVVPTTIPELPVAPTTIPEPQETQPVAPVPEDDGEEPVSELPDTTPPLLEVTSPSDGDRFSTKIVTFSGITETDATVMASGKFPAAVGSDGSWSIDLVLATGANGVVFRALDPAGNESEVRLTVHLDAEEPPATTTTTAAEWVFTANQKYGTCSEPLPYDVFSGKAKPGTTVTVSSPHGGGTAAVDVDGTWSVRVEFPTASYNVSFTVTVKDYTGASKTFPFVSLYKG